MNTQANPYIGPRTFQENERDRFFGRKREARDLLALVVSEQLALFYAQSGAGKSSLVNTCLIPDLKSKGFQIFTGRVAGDAPSAVQVENIYVFNLLRSLGPKESTLDTLASMKISEFLSSAWDDTNFLTTHQEEQISKPHALIIDQFEEIFSTHQEAWEKRRNFFQQLADAMETDPYLWVVLILREDFIAALDPYAYLLPSRFRRRYYMQRLERHAALEAIKKPVQNLRPYADGVAEKLVDDLCSIRVYRPDGTLDMQPGQYVEPVQLQVICYNLWENLPLEETQITEQDLQDVGDVNTSLGNYYAGRVRAVSEAKHINERKIRGWFADKLISPGGIRNMVLQEPGGKSSGLENDVIQALPDLIRAEQRGGATFYELTHDRLVEPIIANNKKWEAEHASPLQKQATLWNDQGRDESWLLIDQGFVEVKEWSKEHPEEITEIEKEFLEACQRLQTQTEERQEAHRQQLEMANKLAEEQARSARRARRFNVIAISLAVLALILAGIAVSVTRQARVTARVASTAEAEAQDQRAKAVTLADTARARELASLAKEKLDENLDLSILLSAEAYNITVKNPKVQSIEAQNALFEEIQRSTRLRGYLANSSHPVGQFRFSPDGKFIAALRKNGEKTELVLWNLEGNLGGVQVLANGAISQFFFSLDSKYLVFLNHDGFTIWDVKNKTELRKNINEHLGAVSQIVFNSDGQTYASLGENGNLILWDVKDSTKKYEPSPSSVAAFSRDGKKFAVFDQVGKVTVGNVTTENQDISSIDQEPDSVTCMAFDQNGNLLAIATKDGNISVWDLINNKETAISFSLPQSPNYPQYPPNVQKMSFQPNGNLMVFDNFGRVYVFDRNTGKPVGDPISGTSVLFSPDGKMFVTFENNNITLYDANTGKPIADEGVKGQLAAFNTDSTLLAIFNNEDDKIVLVNLQTGQPTGEAFPKLTSSAVSMAFSLDSNLLAVGTEDGSITLWEVNSRRLRTSDRSQVTPVSSLAFSPNNKTLIAGRRDSKLTVWDFDTSKPESKAINFPGYIYSTGFNPDGQFLYSIANDGVSLFDLNALATVGPILSGNSVQFIRDSAVMAVINYKDSEINLWNTSNHQLINKISGAFQQLSPKQRVLIVGNKDKTFSLWSTLTGVRFPMDDIQNSYILFSPDEKFAYSLDGNNIHFLEEISSGISNTELGAQRFVAFSPDDKVLITSTVAGELELRNPATGDLLVATPIKAENVKFSPDGKYMIAYSLNSTENATLWDLSHLETIGQPLPKLSWEPIISRDGWTLALRSPGGIYLLDVRSGKLGDRPLQDGAVVFSQDGKILAIDSNGTITLWDVRQNKSIGTPIAGSFVGFSSNGAFAVIKSGTGNNQLILEDTSTGNQIGSGFRVQSNGLGNVVFNPNGTMLAIRGDDGRIDLQSSSIQPENYSGPQAADALVFSPDEKTLTSFDTDGSLTLWDIFVPFLAENTVKDFTSPIKSVRLSPDNNILAVSSEDNISLWNMGDHSLLGNLSKNHIKEPLDVYLSPNGKALVMTNNDKSLSLWNTDTSQQVDETIPETFNSFSPDSRIMVTSQYNGYSTLYGLWDISTGKLIGDHLLGDSLSFSQDGQFIAFHPSGQDSCVILKHATDDQNKELIQMGNPIPGSFSGFGLDGKVVISSRYSSKDNSTHYEFWDMSLENPTSVAVTSSGINLWRVSPDGKIAVFYTYNGPSSTNTSSYTFYPWDLEKHEPIGRPIENINYSTVSSDFSFLASTDLGQFKIWNLRTGTSSKALPGTASSFSPDSKFVASTDTSGDITLWDTAGEKISGPFEGSFTGFSGNDSGQIVFRSYEEGGFILYNTQSGKRIRQEAIPGDALFFSSDGQFFASYYYGRGGLTLWRTATATAIRHNIVGRFIGFSADNKILVTVNTSDNDSNISLWDTSNNQGDAPMTFRYPGALNPNGGIKLSDNNEQLAVFGNAGTFIWQLSEPSQYKAIRDYTGEVARMFFSPNGKILATVGNDGIILWDVLRRQQIGKTLTGQTGHITDLSFDQESKSLAYLNSNGSIFKVDLANVDQVNENRKPLETFTGACRMVLSPNSTRLAYKNGNRFFIWDVEKQTGLTQWETNISCSGSTALSPDDKMLAYSEGSHIYLSTFNETVQAPKTVELTGVVFSNSINDLTFIFDDQQDQILAATGDDGRIFFWDVRNHGLLGTINQAGQARKVTNGKLQIFIPSENRMILLDFTPNVWQKLLKKWRADLCEKAGRNLTPAEFLQYFSDRDFRNYTGTCPQWPVETETTANAAP